MNRHDNLDAGKLKYVIYCRKSSEGEDKQIQSLETQLRELTEHAQKNELEIIEVISESKSAFKPGREGFNRMTNLINSGKANAILVIRANRISRNPIDAGYITSLLDEKKLLYIRTPSSTCYTSSSTDKMMISLELIFSKKDSDDKSDAVKDGQRTKAVKGVPHGIACLGFINDTKEEIGNKKWMVDNERIWKIDKLLKLFLTGTYSAGKLYRHATEELKLTTVIRKKSGGNLIVQSRIYDILKDPIYAGFFFYEGVRYELDRNLPRLITESEYNKIQNILSRKNIPKIQHHETTYSGFLYSEENDFMGQDLKFQVICDCKNKFAYRDKTHCPNCDIEINQMENPKYLNYTHYYNVRKKKSKEPYKSISEDKVTKVITDFMENNLNFSDDLLNWSKKYIHELKDKEVSDNILIHKDKEKRIEEYENKKSKLRAMLRDEKITDDEYNKDLLSLNKEYSDTKTEIKNSNCYEEMMEVADLTQCALDIFKTGSVKAKRTILSRLGSNLVWNDQKLSIYNKKSIQALTDGLKNIKSEFPKFEPRLSFNMQDLNEKNESFDPLFSSMLPD